MTISEKLSLIQVEFKAKKSRYNSFGKYNFRSAEDILEGLKPFNEKHKVFFTVNEELLNVDPPIICSKAKIHDCESSETIQAIAIVGVDLNQKGMQTSQQYGSTSSYGKKYALGNLLLIDDTADADSTNTHSSENKNPDWWSKAVEYVNNGGDINEIQKKKGLSESQLKKLAKECNVQL